MRGAAMVNLRFEHSVIYKHTLSYLLKHTQNLQFKPDQPPRPLAYLIANIHNTKRAAFFRFFLFVFTVVIENFHQHFFPSTTTTTTSINEPMSPSPSTLTSSVSMSNHYPTVQYLPPIGSDDQLWFQSSYPHFQNQSSQPPSQYPNYPLLVPRLQPNPISEDQGEIESKTARDERRMARQKGLFLSRSAAESGSFSSSTQMDLCGADSDVQNTEVCTPDMKELSVLFKELKKSDVGCWGRIVIPKKNAEKYLPSLSEKQGIVLWIRDVHSSQVWGMKYKYWANNKSRMYILDSAGSLIRKNGLKVGDWISIYEDASKNFYFSIDKAGQAESLHEQQHYATDSKDDNGDINSSSINTQIANSNDNHKNINTTNYRDSINSAYNPYIQSETNSNNTKLYTPYTFSEEDELYLAALLEDESDKVETLYTDPAF